jgi:hypothetical protein
MEGSSIKNTITQLCFYAVITVLEMLVLSIFAHINFLKDAVYIYYYRMLYYTGIASAILFALLLVVHFVRKRNKRFLNIPVILSAIIISALFTALFVTAGPMPIDRSYSIFSIADMYEHSDRVYSAEEIEQAFMNQYIVQNEATKRRIEEQKSIGNIEETDEGGYRITEKGQRLIKTLRLVETFYPADEKRTLYPE